MKAGREYIPRGPQDEEKTLSELEAEQGDKKGTKKKSKLATAALAGASLIMPGLASGQERPPQGPSKKAEVAETLILGGAAAGLEKVKPGSGSIISDIDRERTERRRIESLERTEKERLEAEKQIQLEREKTMRQQEAMRTAREAGWKKVKTTTTKNETILENEEGQTPEERMQLQQQLHEQEMEKQRRINSASEFIQKIKKLAAEKPTQEKQE